VIDMLKRIGIVILVIFSFTFQQIAAQAKDELLKSKLFDTTQLLNDVRILSADEMQGRQVGSPGGIKARDYVIKRFQELGLQSFNNSYSQSFEFSGRGDKKIEGANVVGYLKGRKNADKYLIITAHYDHLGTRNGEVFNGADDNASGTAALFAMAAYFKKYPPKNSLKKERVLLNINMDMIAHNDVNELYVSGTRHYPSLKTYLAPVAKQSKVKLLFGHDQPSPPQDDWTNQSDHYPFHQAKIPFLYFGVEDHKDYHRSTDDFVNINQAFYVHAVETILEAVKVLDKNLTSAL
jgi:Zn-dependent M28 family amino/carboxypeptidase